MGKDFPVSQNNRWSGSEDIDPRAQNYWNFKSIESQKSAVLQIACAYEKRGDKTGKWRAPIYRILM